MTTIHKGLCWDNKIGRIGIRKCESDYQEVSHSKHHHQAVQTVEVQMAHPVESQCYSNITIKNKEQTHKIRTWYSKLLIIKWSIYLKIKREIVLAPEFNLINQQLY